MVFRVLHIEIRRRLDQVGLAFHHILPSQCLHLVLSVDILRQLADLIDQRWHFMILPTQHQVWPLMRADQRLHQRLHRRELPHRADALSFKEVDALLLLEQRIFQDIQPLA